MRPARDFGAAQRREHCLELGDLGVCHRLHDVGALRPAERELAFVQAIEWLVVSPRAPHHSAETLTQPQPQFAALDGRDGRDEAAIVADDARGEDAQQGQTPVETGEQLIGPGAGSDDDGISREIVAVGLDPHRTACVMNGFHFGLVAHDAT